MVPPTLPCVLAAVPVPVPEGDGPSPQERRRGATYRVACLACGVTLWRRQKDVEAGIKPFCPKHRWSTNPGRG